MTINKNHVPCSTAPYPCTPVNALLDVVIFDYSKVDRFEKCIRVWSNIVCVDKCDVEIIKKKIYTNFERKIWIIDIEYKLIIFYTTKTGRHFTLCKTFCYNKELPFPDAAPESQHFDDCPKPIMDLIVKKAECISFDLIYIDCYPYIVVNLEFDFQVLGILKKNLPVMIFTPQCK